MTLVDLILNRKLNFFMFTSSTNKSYYTRVGAMCNHYFLAQ